MRSAPGRQRARASGGTLGHKFRNWPHVFQASSRDSEGIFNLVHGYYRYTSECYKLHTAVIRKKRILTRVLKLIEGESTQSGSGDAAVGILLALARWLSWLGGKFFLLNPGSVSTLAMHLPFNQRPLSHSSAWSPCAAPPCPGRIDAHLACCPRSAPGGLFLFRLFVSLRQPLVLPHWMHLV